MAERVNDNIVIENARIGFRNFAGEEGQFNRAGDRNFVVFLDEDYARELDDLGWNIKWPKPIEDGNPDEDERQPFLPVGVRFAPIPPKVVEIINGEKHYLDEDTVGALDYARILDCDLIVRPYNWSASGKTGVKAYLKSIYVTVDVDDLEAKYGF